MTRFIFLLSLQYICAHPLGRWSCRQTRLVAGHGRIQIACQKYCDQPSEYQVRQHSATRLTSLQDHLLREPLQKRCPLPTLFLQVLFTLPLHCSAQVLTGLGQPQAAPDMVDLHLPVQRSAVGTEQAGVAARDLTSVGETSQQQ